MKKNPLFEKCLASVEPEVKEEVNRNVDKFLNMKTGDIIRIHTRELYEIVDREPIDNCNICCIKGSCPLMNNQAGWCLEPLKLEYGRWYKCDEVMPEELMEHHHWNTSTTTGQVVAQNSFGQLRITNRYLDESGWHWLAGRKNIKRWLAIPAIYP